MRPRTKSVVNVHEYFSQDDGESDQEEEDEDDLQLCPWLRGASRSNKALKRSSAGSAFAKNKKAAAAKRERTSTLESWEGTDIDDDDEEYDEEFDDDDDESDRRPSKCVERLRTCSHDRRISFDSDVNVVTIPARSSFDAEYKRRVWYSPEEYSLMRQLG